MVSIDVDDSTTWPDEVRAIAVAVADRFPDPDDSISDGVFFEEDRWFVERLSGARLRAYHCTRLLDHEVEAIRSTGLKTLTRELIAVRLEAAAEVGAITAEEAEHLRVENFLKDPIGPMSREHLLHLFIGREALDEELSLNHFLGEWGGEVISFWNERTTYRERLAQIGRPAIVVAELDFSEHDMTRVYPGVLHCFVARVLDREGGATVTCRTPVPRENIIDIWQPGHPEYDRHAQLLQT